MKLSISNIAWDLSEENKVMDIMRSYNLNGIEIAPTKLWEIPIDLSDQTITDYLKKTESFGLRIVAMQSLLFNRMIFVYLRIKTPEKRRMSTCAA